MAPFRDRDFQHRCRYGDVEYIHGRGIFSFTPFSLQEAGFERMDINLAGCSPESSYWLRQGVFFFFDGHWTKIGTIADFFEYIERHNNIQLPVRSESYFNPDTNEQHIDATMQIRTIDVRILEEPFYHLRRIAEYLFRDERSERWYAGRAIGSGHLDRPRITSSQREPFPQRRAEYSPYLSADDFEGYETGFQILKNRESKEVELKAELLLEKVIGRSKFNEWKKTGKFTWVGNFGTYEFKGTDVVLERTDKIGEGLEKKLWYRLCIQPKEKLPLADVLASKVLLLKSDEVQFCKTSNFRSVSTKDEYVGNVTPVPGGNFIGGLVDRILT